MTDGLVFRAGWAKRALGWIVCLGAAVALIALVLAIVRHWETQSTADLWSGLAIAIFVLAILVGGIAIQYGSWRAEGDTITLQRLFGTKTFRVSELEGFGKTIVIVSLFPVAHIDLYGPGLRPVARLPIAAGDLPRAEAWLSARLRYVINEGSPALPKRRFADAGEQ